MTSLRTPLPTLLASALCVGALLGCSNGNGKGDGGVDAGPTDSGPPSCERREDCSDGLACIDGFCDHCARERDCLRCEHCNPLKLICEFAEGCGADCELHSECGLGEFCVTGLCAPGSEVTTCVNDSECPEDDVCNTTTLVCEQDLGCEVRACPTGFYCDLATSECLISCTADNEAEVCATGFRCLDGQCIECVEDADCPPGFTCDPTLGRCVGPRCISNLDCLLPEVCNPLTAQCTVAPPPCLSSEDCAAGKVCQISTGDCVSEQCLPDALEPNDVPADATDVSPGLLSNLTLCAQEQDWYRLALGAGDRVSATINPPPLSGSNFIVTLYDPAATSPLASGNLQLDHTVNSVGDYLLLVQTTDPRAAYSVQLLVSRGVPCDDDPYEPNDQLTQAVRLTIGQYFNLQKCPGNGDWYEIEVLRDTTATIALDHDPLQGDLDLFVYDSDGVSLLAKSETTNPTESVTLDQTSGNRAFIEVRAAAGTQNAYDLSLGIQ